MIAEEICRYNTLLREYYYRLGQPVPDDARADEIAQLNRFMPHSTDRKNTGKSIINQVCGMVRLPRNFR